MAVSWRGLGFGLLWNWRKGGVLGHWYVFWLISPAEIQHNGERADEVVESSAAEGNSYLLDYP
jgi:hypothetical protein